MFIWAKIKQYAYLGIGLLISIASLGIARKQVKKANRRAEEAEALAHWERAVVKRDKEVKETIRRRRIDALEEIGAGGVPDEFTDPNSLFDKDKDS